MKAENNYDLPLIHQNTQRTPILDAPGIISDAKRAMYEDVTDDDLNRILESLDGMIANQIGIEILDETVTIVRDGSTYDGAPTGYTQQAIAHRNGAKYPEPVTLELPSDTPYRVGYYTIDVYKMVELASGRFDVVRYIPLDKVA